MNAALLVILIGVLMRLVDRAVFSPRLSLTPPFFRRPPATTTAIKELQRQQLNNITPALLMAGHWVEIAGWWALSRHLHVWGAAGLVLVIAVKFRHLQETTHFAVHGSLCKSRRLGDVLAEVGFQAPLGMVLLERRRETHAWRHHPNATTPGADPNVEELLSAGIAPGCTATEFKKGVLYPVRLRGIRDSGRGMWERWSRSPRWRLLGPAAVVAVALYCGGVPAAVFGFLAPRLTVYPLLAWMSLLVEHRWFAPDIPKSSRVETEAARCIKLYGRRPILRLLALSTWLPYGDLYHFAHSAFPKVRWNYLPLVDRVLARGPSEFQAFAWGRRSVLRSLYADAIAATRDVPRTA